MTGLHEASLIIVGLGTALFMLALSRIVTHEAARALDYHFLQIKAMKLRNRYARTVLALSPNAAPRAGLPDGPDDEIMVVAPIDETSEPDRRAA